MQTMTEEVLTLKEAAEVLRVSEMTILRLVQRGALPGVKIGRQWRFSREKLFDLIQPPDFWGKP